MPTFSAALPQIDANLIGAWTEQDRSRWQTLPFYLEKLEAEDRVRFSTWDKLITQTMDFKPNESEILRGVIVERTPLIRQEARPNYLKNEPKRDIYDVAERTIEARLHRQEFVSPHFNFEPSFTAFLKGNLLPMRKNIEEQIRMYKEIYLRTALWDAAPYVYVCGVGLVPAPVGLASEGVSNKTAAWYQNDVGIPMSDKANCELSFSELYKILNIFTDEVGGTPYEGSGQPGGESAPLNEKYCLVTSSSQWNQFVDDPWLKENRPLDMNVVTGAFRGDFFGRIRSKIERYPLRRVMDSEHSPTLPAPETRDLTNVTGQFNRTIPNPSYAKVSNSQHEVSWLLGGRIAKKLDAGAPPEFFAGGVTDPAKIPGMNWNGMVYASKMFGVPRVAADGTTIMDFNEFGRYTRFQAELALGIIVPWAWNALPIIHRRRVGLTNALQSGV